jgi:hypothetical protein
MEQPTVSRIHVPAALHALAAMGMLLERLDRLPRQASPAQYREVVRRTETLLAQAEPGRALDELLGAMPALGELWENQQYARAGLCRAPLDEAVEAEIEARQAIAQAMGRSGWSLGRTGL